MSSRVAATSAALLLSLVSTTPQALASAPPEAAAQPPPPTLVEPEATPQQAPPAEPPRSRKGIPLIAAGGALMGAGLVTGVVLFMAILGDGLAGGSGSSPTVTGLGIAFPCAMVPGLGLLIAGSIRNANANAALREQASAHRWTPSVGFGPHGGQLGLRLRF